MKRAVTLKENHQFRNLYRRGASAVSGSMVLYCRKNKLGHNRLGITVSVKLGHAVVRNRAADGCGRCTGSTAARCARAMISSWWQGPAR